MLVFRSDIIKARDIEQSYSEGVLGSLFSTASIIFFDDIDIHFIDKRPNKPKQQDTWDNNDWMIGILKGDDASMQDLPDIGRSGLATLRAFLQYLVDKNWLKMSKK